MVLQRGKRRFAILGHFGEDPVEASAFRASIGSIFGLVGAAVCRTHQKRSPFEARHLGLV